MKIRNISGVDQRLELSGQSCSVQREVKEVKEAGRVIHKAQKAGVVEVPKELGEKLVKTGDWEAVK